MGRTVTVRKKSRWLTGITAALMFSGAVPVGAAVGAAQPQVGQVSGSGLDSGTDFDPWPDRPTVIEGQFIVSLKDGTTRASIEEALETTTRAHGVELAVERQLGTGGLLVSATGPLRTQVDVEQVRAAMSDLDAVTHVDPDTWVYSFALPTDPMVPQQWPLWRPYGGLNANDTSAMGSGEGVVVGVIDTGITKHPELDSHIVAGYDMVSRVETARDGDGRDPDPTDEGTYAAAAECGSNLAMDSSWHGSHVAGTIAASANNGVGVAGVAPKASIEPIRVLGRCGSGSSADVMDAVIWASGGDVPGIPKNPKPVDVINLSLGGKDPCKPEEAKAYEVARSKGIVSVIASGNSKDNAANYSPANCPGVIAVAAVNQHGSKAVYSNFGPTITVSAPGGETWADNKVPGVLSTVNAGKTKPTGPGYASYAGTSMATPHVAGVVALLKGVKPGIGVDEVESALKSTARPLPGKCEGGCGAGIVDATAAMHKVLGTCPPTPGSNAVSNGGFESAQGWNLSGKAAVVAGGKTGSALKLNGTKFPRTDAASQRITLPGKRARLEFWVKIESEETQEVKNDVLTVSVGGKVVATLGSGDNTNSWIRAIFDLPENCGSGDLVFTGKEDSFRMTGFMIDDVALYPAL